MGYYRDFREFLSKLEEIGRLRTISKPVDKDREMHPLVRWQYRGIEEADRFGFLFEQVVDRHGKSYRGKVASSVVAPNREVYALALNCPANDVHDRWTRALGHPIETRKVATGPVKEEIHRGDKLLEHDGIREFPIPIATNGWEAFPRITAGGFFTRDPETGGMNAGMYNSLSLGPERANIRTSRHLRLHWNKARRKGIPLEVALVVGAQPAVCLVTAMDVPHGTYELDVAGGLIGEPIDVVGCETVDLEVPATAEVVIEGRIPTDRMDLDGPSGENRGHVMPGGPVHSFEITCITHRKDPIWHDVICQFPPSESSMMRIVNCEGRVLSVLRAHGIPHVKDVAFHHCGSARHLCVVRFRNIDTTPVRNAEVWQALYTVMSVDSSWPKIAIAVDEDIDPWDLESVFWAACNRFQPHRDMKVIQGRSAGLDESVAPREQAFAGRGYPPSMTGPQGASIMLMDATRKWANAPISLPKKKYMEHARELWDQLQLPPLKPREPWHGVSQGFWPDLEEQLVSLTEEGREDEAAE
ncbi:MAG: UbiD family decarboxylase, partial [Deltaproteobacteria bacterium]|nr:UbiD family decarboxylase [Deltaproteobacteria bacterium]